MMQQGLKGGDEKMKVSLKSQAVALDGDLNKSTEPPVRFGGRFDALGHLRGFRAKCGDDAERELGIPLLHAAGLLIEERA